MNKNKKMLVFIIVFILSGVWIIWKQKTEWVPPKNVACTQEAMVCPDGSAVGREGPNCEFSPCPTVESDYSWEFKQVSEVNEALGIAPRTQVTLKTGGKSYNAGIHEGNCSKISTGWTLLPHEIDGVICYFAGFGSEVGIFSENGELVVKKRVIEEGTPEDGGIRGNFEVLFKL